MPIWKVSVLKYGNSLVPPKHEPHHQSILPGCHPKPGIFMMIQGLCRSPDSQALCFTKTVIYYRRYSTLLPQPRSLSSHSGIRSHTECKAHCWRRLRHWVDLLWFLCGDFKELSDVGPRVQPVSWEETDMQGSLF